jgi:hypothetical protein
VHAAGLGPVLGLNGTLALLWAVAVIVRDLRLWRAQILDEGWNWRWRSWDCLELQLREERARGPILCLPWYHMGGARIADACRIGDASAAYCIHENLVM